MTANTLQTNNTDWGFYGTMRHHADPEQAWPRALEAVALATGCPDTAVRDLLDSRHGRHFADDIANAMHAGHGLEEAIENAIARWQGWRIGRKTSSETPAGLPYLTGFATHFQILDEADA